MEEVFKLLLERHCFHSGLGLPDGAVAGAALFVRVLTLLAVSGVEAGVCAAGGQAESWGGRQRPGRPSAEGRRGTRGLEGPWSSPLWQ